MLSKSMVIEHVIHKISVHMTVLSICIFKKWRTLSVCFGNKHQLVRDDWNITQTYPDICMQKARLEMCGFPSVLRTKPIVDLIMFCWIWEIKKERTVLYSRDTHRSIHSLVAAKLILAKLKQIQNNTSGQCSYRLSSLIQMQGTSD